MKTITNASWTRQGNVNVELKNVVSFTESFGKQVPVTAGKSEFIEVEIADKNIEATDNTAEAIKIIYSFFASQGIEVFQKTFKIL